MSSEIYSTLVQLSHMAGAEADRIDREFKARGIHRSETGDNYESEQLRVLKQRIDDAIAEYENPGSELDALTYALKERRARFRPYTIGPSTLMILDFTMDKHYKGRTIVEAARKVLDAARQAEQEVEGGGQ